LIEQPCWGPSPPLSWPSSCTALLLLIDVVFPQVIFWIRSFFVLIDSEPNELR
jgi:hypothetical protein